MFNTTMDRRPMVVNIVVDAKVRYKYNKDTMKLLKSEVMKAARAAAMDVPKGFSMKAALAAAMDVS
jgi:hypothetical protein